MFGAAHSFVEVSTFVCVHGQAAASPLCVHDLLPVCELEDVGLRLRGVAAYLDGVCAFVVAALQLCSVRGERGWGLAWRHGRRERREREACCGRQGRLGWRV